jgi:hypothetical protein
MGLGFYGQSFTLASPHCQDPGCIWVHGPQYFLFCTYADPLTRVRRDRRRQIRGLGYVGYITRRARFADVLTFRGQWVSYDDSESFAVKMNYANNHCIGGTMIWSMDQDDDKCT